MCVYIWICIYIYVDVCMYEYAHIIHISIYIYMWLYVDSKISITRIGKYKTRSPSLGQGRGASWDRLKFTQQAVQASCAGAVLCSFLGVRGIVGHMPLSDVLIRRDLPQKKHTSVDENNTIRQGLPNMSLWTRLQGPMLYACCCFRLLLGPMGPVCAGPMGSWAHGPMGPLPHKPWEPCAH